MLKVRLRRGVWRLRFQGNWSLVDGQWFPMLARRWKDKGKRRRRSKCRRHRQDGK